MGKHTLAAKAARKLRIAALHQKYRRSDHDPAICVYCGQPADTLDHVPPVSWVHDVGVEEFEKRGVTFWLVPACRWCNSAIGARKIPFVRDRAAAVAEKIRKSLLEHEARWTLAELDELGPNLRSYVEMYWLIREREQRRMDHAQMVSALDFLGLTTNLGRPS